MKAEVNKDAIMCFTCESDEELQQIKTWVLLNEGKFLIPENRTELALTKFNSLKVAIFPKLTV